MSITISSYHVGNGELIVLAGPCVVEGRDFLLKTAERVVAAASHAGIPLVFKSSYKKANRTSGASFTGIGDDEALRALADVKQNFSVPLVTDVHSQEEVRAAADVVDVLQIPAFLSRQTDLLLAAAKTGKAVNIKKGQFAAPEDMAYAAGKVVGAGNNNVMLCERGTTFGYHDLIVDMRSLVVMHSFGFPVIFDATHSVQKPSRGSTSGGTPEFIPPLARAAAAVGVDGFFIETHPDPPNAKSDAATQYPLDKFEALLRELKTIDEARRSLPGA